MAYIKNTTRIIIMSKLTHTNTQEKKKPKETWKERNNYKSK